MPANLRICPDTLDAPVRPRPPLLRALGCDDPPDCVEVGGKIHRRVRIFKHDSWAATALYQGHAGQMICKFNRRQPIGLIPMRWLGRLLARREAAFLRALAEVPNVPRWSGYVFAYGQWLSNAVAREYIPGRTLRYDEPVSSRFFSALEAAMLEIHRHDIAYVDLHKPENVLIGNDGRPYLFDFQISIALPSWQPARFLGRVGLGMLQQSDLYHLRKHEVRHAARRGSTRPLLVPPWWIRAHRRVAVPFRTLRRWLLVKLGVRGRQGRVETEHFVEEGLRTPRLAA